MSDLDTDDNITPTDDDLQAVTPVEPDQTITQADADAYWDADENVRDDRYDGDGIPSWSIWAE
jgi:hypothetical protein